MSQRSQRKLLVRYLLKNGPSRGTVVRLPMVEKSTPRTLHLSQNRKRTEEEPEPVETGPAFDYTGVSMGELGRGAPEGTLPPGTVEYAGGVDPEMEVLSALKNSSSDPIGEGLMNTGEYLAATKYENEKADASPAMAGTQFASAAETMTDESPDLTFTNPLIGYESGQDVLQSYALTI